jgi:L-alanine-DL-glutamate epimerase-like enolase superfamily enzyme
MIKGNYNSINRRKFLSLGGAGVLLSSFTGKNAVIDDAQFSIEYRNIRITGVESWILKTGSLFVIIRTSAGITGIGECSPMDIKVNAGMIENALVPRIIGENPLDINMLWEKMYFGTYKLGTMGVQPESIAGIDIALWDILGKVTNLPLYRLLGGRRRDKVRMYSSIGNGSKTSVDEMVKLAVDSVEKGFTALKIRMDWGNNSVDANPEHDWKMMSEVRKAVGDKIELGFDVNNGYSVSTAIKMGKKMYEELGIIHYEEPIAQFDYDGLAQVVEELDVPIACGEHEYTRWQFRDLINITKVDILQPDLVKCAGISEAIKIAGLATTYNKMLVPHQTQPTIGTAVNLHFTSCFAIAESAQEFNKSDEKTKIMNRAFKNPLIFENGYFSVPEAPGIGLEIDENELKKLRV